MGSTALAVVLGVVWVGSGLLAAFVLLGRQGYRDWRWYVTGAVLGPLFVPVAAERADRSVRVLDAGPDAVGAGATVVVGVDGSSGADEAVRLAVPLAAVGARVVLVAVVDPDAGDGPPDDERRVRARSLLDDRARWFGRGSAVTTEVVGGQPARALLAVARAEGAAVIVLVPRPAGPPAAAAHLLGDVGCRLAHRAPVPVLLARPPASRSAPAAGSKDPAVHDRAGSPSRP
ncbi:hypothetical protein GCM10023200_27420 [Actinomycetospora chlora]|uniref:UspA domain-containing protein n=1 Tax=Actinomycetospora chlora TaxID=663608 RepID=A0ABP9B6A5_9PSEU